MSRGLTSTEARTQIDGTAKDMGFPGFDLFYGWGRVDALAATTEFPSFPPIGDTTPPTVSFVSPSGGLVITTNTVTVTVAATEDVELSLIELRVVETQGSWQISTLVASSTRSPLTYKWRTSGLASGTYTLDARALDAAGHAASARVTVTKP
jgi:hypothetical protein